MTGSIRVLIYWRCPRFFVLDRVHLYLNARRAFGYTHRTETWIKNICEGGLEKVLLKCWLLPLNHHPGKLMPWRLLSCIWPTLEERFADRDGLLDPNCRSHLRKGLDNLGGIEGNVDKLVVYLLKSRGSSWRLDGVKAMLEVCRHKEELRQGALKAFIKSSDCCQPKKARQKKIDYGEWMQADVPAIHLCHSGRPWAKVLKEIVHPKGVL